MQGLYTALITPFNAKLEIDYVGLQKNIEEQIAASVDGLVLLGSTGEAATLTADEKRQAIRAAKEVVKNQVPLIIGTSSNSTQEAIDLTAMAKELGADGALVATPYYNRPPQEGIYRHFAAIAAATSLPLIVYNIPSRAAQNIELATLKKIATLPSIVAIKESSGNLTAIVEQIVSLPNLPLFAGDDLLTLPIIASGGKGLISVISNFCPKEVKAFVDASLNHQIELAQSYQHKLCPLIQAAFIETNPIPIKHMLNYCQKAAGPCRLPLLELSPSSKPTVETAVDQFTPKSL